MTSKNMKRHALKMRRFVVAAQMPPLRHKVDSQFSLQKSEVVKWLLSQESILQYVFDVTQQTGMIEYDATTGTWRGKDWEPTHPEEWRF